MTLQKARIATLADTLTYYSKNFSIITEWDGGKQFVINVYGVAKVLEVVQLNGKFADAEEAFEELKTRYILK